ncbi:MAG: class I SAM-dependent methyltransferase [Actinobacteria bacterium]|nr:class I SAM-dependent methyltransferase [Actinomycetota bacterium]
MKDKKNFDFSPALYDMQVNWPARFEKERGFFEKIISERSVNKILDVGCGTGRHVQLFSEIVNSLKTGQRVKKAESEKSGSMIVGIDPAAETIEYAKKSVVTSPDVKLIVGGFENIDSLVAGQFDLITCLGNTLALLENRRRVKMALKAVRRKLVSGGLAIFQFLNFEPKIIEKERYYSPKTFAKDEFKYITLKHFQFGKIKTMADFIKIKIAPSGSIEDFQVSTSFMCTLRKSLFLKMAKNAGFKKIELFSPGGQENFDKNRHVSLNALLYN